MQPILDAFKDPLFIVVLASSVVGWMLGVVKGFSSVSDWLKKFFPSPNPWVVFLLDLFVFSIVGAVLGILIYGPDEIKEAIAAGISWPVGFGALATKTTDGEDGDTIESRSKKIPATFRIYAWALLGVLILAILLDFTNISSVSRILVWIAGLVSLVLGYYFVTLRTK